MNNRTLDIGLRRIKFKNNHVVYENFVKCTIKDYEFNLSYNSSLLSGSQAQLFAYSGSNGDNVFYETTSSRYYGILKDFATGSISGSEFSPYVTTVGLYNDSNELLAIGKMAAPIPISANTDMTFLIKYDTQWTEKPYFTPSPSPTPSISVSTSVPATPSVTPSITVTPSVTPTVTPSKSIGSTPSVTPSLTTTPSVTITPTVTPSVTPTVTPSITVSVTPTITPSSSSPLGQCYVIYNEGNYDASISYLDKDGNASCMPVMAGGQTYLCVKSGTGGQIYPYIGLGCTGGTAPLLTIVNLGENCSSLMSCY